MNVALNTGVVTLTHKNHLKYVSFKKLDNTYSCLMQKVSVYSIL